LIKIKEMKRDNIDTINETGLCIMTAIHHLNCGILQSPFMGKAICHCLLLEDKNGLALVDTGFGVADVRDPSKSYRAGNDRFFFDRV
jgi:hypothetical protein